MNVIGKATLNWEKYTEYVQRETINVKEHPEDSWYLDIRYKVPHTLTKHWSISGNEKKTKRNY